MHWLFPAAGFGAVLSALIALPPAPKPAGIPAPRPAAADAPPGVDYSIPPGELVPTALEVMAADADADVADWGHQAIGVPEAWKVTKGAGAVVAVLDTGVDLQHRDLKGQVKAAKNFTTSRNGVSDVQGHGTHCAGVVLAAENQTGMVGVAPQAKLLAGKVLGDGGQGSSLWINAGVDWAVEQGADVISMSLGGPSPDDASRAAVRRAAAAGVVVVAAAGNEGPRDGTVGYPGGYPEVVCVAAVDASLATAGFSSRGPAVLVAAPGVNVRSCYPGDRFATMSGTSMSTPYVAGCAALYCSYKKGRGEKPDPAEFKALLGKSSRDLPPAGRDRGTGFGLVQPTGLFPASVVPPPVPVPPPGPGRDVFLFWDDLTPEARKRLGKE